MKKVIVITGASGGLGREIARIYKQKGNYHLVLSGRNEKGLEEFKNSPDVNLVIGDITKNETIDKVYEKVKSLNQIDILINNAGIIYIQPFEENQEKQLDLLFAVDLKAPIMLTKRIYPLMVAQKSGQIININSTTGKEAKANHTLYSAAKFGLLGFTNALRLEAKNHNIKVLSFHPGGMNTDFYDEMEGVPVEKFMDPQKIAKILVELSETDPSISPDEIIINRMTR